MKLSVGHRSQGNILGSTILVLAIITTLYLAISSVMLVHLRWSTRTENRELAMLAAKSAVNKAIGEIRADLNFEEDIAIDFGDEYGGGTAHLTFSKSGEGPWSSNNAQGDSTIEGWDGHDELSRTQVFPRTAKLVAVGECRGARYVAEAMLSFPQFPYALASSGQVLADGELEVLAVEKLSDANDGVTPSEERAGHIVSNSSQPDAIQLNSQVKVSGDVRAVGTVVANGANIEGDEISGSDETHIIDMALERPPNADPDAPGIYIKDYDPERPELMSENLTIVKSAGEAEGLADGLDISEVRYKINANGGTVNLNNGVKLSDGLLYVDGDVVIRGGVQGTGAVFATGKITIIGPTSLDSDNAALISGGGVTLDGQGLGRSKFRGLVATLGDFVADSSEITGAYIAAGTDPQTNLGNSKMVLEDVKVIQAPDATKVNLDVHRELKIVMDPDSKTGQDIRSSGAQVGLKVGDKFYTFTGDPTLSGSLASAEVDATYQNLKASVGEIDSGDYAFSTGIVVIREPDGNGGWKEEEVPESRQDATTPLEFAGVTLREQWEAYEGSVRNTSTDVQVTPILDIDLSKFTSGTSRTQIVYYLET